ncbi:MAG: hypothetical protein OEO17_16025, partial [Gemmatimonadota bacterium]|nr:hypothetical protein [Gemmatimonadota bacterium]
MRLAIVLVVLVGLALGALMIGGTAQPDDAEPAPAAVEPAAPADPYGAPLGGANATQVAPQAAPSAPEAPSSSAEHTSVETTPTTATGAEPAAGSAPALVVDVGAVGEGTTLVDDDTEQVHQGGLHSEEEPEDEFPGLGEGEYPISSNLPEGTDYPLAEMVRLAVDVLAAETTGEGRDQYPHLADQVSVCCVDLTIDGTAVLFGSIQADPATIIVEWHALDAAD